MNKKLARIRRAMKIRKKIYQLESIRLVVHRTSKHIYAQVISQDNCHVLAAASTTEKFVSNQLLTTGNKKAAAIVGKLIAERSIKQGIINVSFDRSGFKYHGRVRMLADHARQSGLRF